MSFLYPIFFWALAALSIPIIVHLFYFKRYKKMDFTLVHFLKSIQEKNKSQRQLKHLLILFSRLLMLFFLIMAFAVPYWQKDEQSIAQGPIVIYIDNSFSLSSADGNARFKELKQSAEAVVNSHPNSTFIVLDNQKISSVQSPVNAVKAIEGISSIVLKGSNCKYDYLLSSVDQIDPISKCYLFSDFQKSFDIEDRLNERSYPIYWMQLPSEDFYNICIDSIWLAHPILAKDQTIKIVVELNRNQFSDEYIQKLNLKVNEQNRGFINADFGRSKTILDTVSLSLDKEGVYKCALEIEDNGLQFDNHYYFTLQVEEKLKVLLINDEVSAQYFDALLSVSDHLHLDSVPISQLDYSQIPNYDLIVLNGLESVSSGLIASLQSRVNQGKDLVILPSFSGDRIQYNNLNNALGLSTYKNGQASAFKLDKINLSSSLFKTVFIKSDKDKSFKLPALNWSWKINPVMNQYSESIVASNDQNLAYRYVNNGANIYQFGFGLDQANKSFMEHAVYPSLFYNMLLESQHPNQLSNQLSSNIDLNVNDIDLGFEDVLSLRAGQKEEWMARIRKIAGRKVVHVDQSDLKAGFYDLVKDGESILTSYAFNIDRKESVLEYYSESELEVYTDQANVKLFEIDSKETLLYQINSEDSDGLWKLCVILALLFLLIEIALIKFL